MICASLYRVFFIKISSDYYAEKILLVNTTFYRGDYQAAGNYIADLGMLEKGTEVSITSTDLAAMMSSNHSRIIGAVNQTLTLATCKPDDITDVIFVGGSGLMGFVVDALKATFPNAEFHTSAVFTAVVDGLAFAPARS